MNYYSFYVADEKVAKIDISLTALNDREYIYGYSSRGKVID